MTVPSFHDIDATGLAALIRDGELSAAEVAEAALERIADSQLNAVIATTDPAPPADGPFHGVPFVVKDLLAWPELPITFGGRLFAGNVPTEHLPYTQRLADSGLVPVGVSASSELGLLGSTETLAYGVTRNPWGAELSAGGSSGGAASAVAAGLVPIAHASDGGGSIRGPAALAGLVGFKPTSHVRATPQPSPMASLVSEGCVSRTVRDTDTWLGLTAVEARRAIGPADAGSLHIAVYTADAFGRDQPSAAIDAVAATLAGLGHRVERVAAPRHEGPAVSDAFFTLAGMSVAGLDQMLAPMLGRALQASDVEPFTWAIYQRFLAKPAGAVDKAMADVKAAGEVMVRFLGQYDVAMCPTIGGPRPRLGHLAPHLPVDVLLERTNWLAGFTAPHNMAGAPAVSLPLAVDDGGLPVGVMFAASPGRDERLLRLAYQLEAAMPWKDRRP